jgi:hypothetical protein
MSEFDKVKDEAKRRSRSIRRRVKEGEGSSRRSSASTARTTGSARATDAAGWRVRPVTGQLAPQVRDAVLRCSGRSAAFLAH